MVWTEPRTWNAGELVKQDDLNTHIRDNQEILKTSIEDDGRITDISSDTFADLDGTSLTGLAKLAAANTFTDGVNDFGGGASARLVLPTGPNKWAT